LDVAEAAEPVRPTADTIDLLDALPFLEMSLARAPEPLLRQLFELTQLMIELHSGSDEVTLTIRLPADYLPKAADTAERINETVPQHMRSAKKKTGHSVVHAVGAAQAAPPAARLRAAEEPAE
jgi:hypothetical protein